MKNAHAPTTSKPHPGIETFFKEDGKFYFHFNDPEGEALFFSRGYATAEDRDAGMEEMITLLAGEAHVDLKKSKNGRFFFTLKSEAQKEIGRSRLFATRKEMEKQLAALRLPNAETPVAGVSAAEKPVKPKPAPVETPPAPETAAPAEASEKMTRYKFSVIYYPNSSAWVIKNDFTGASRQLGSCDGPQIADFLRAQLPAGEQDHNSGLSVSDHKGPSGKAAPGKVVLHLLTQEGEVSGQQVRKDDLLSVEVSPFPGELLPALPAEVRVMARNLDDNRTAVIGVLKNALPADNRFSVPVGGACYLKPGNYLLIAKIFQDAENPAVAGWYGSRLVVLG